MIHTGSLTISAQNYATYALLEEVTGNLTIQALSLTEKNPVLNSLTFTKLTKIKGSVSLHHNTEMPQLGSVAGSLTVADTATFSAPHLKTVGGDVDLGGKSSLPALLSVAGDLAVYDASEPPPEEEGDYDYDQERPWTELRHFLPALSSVGGRLSIYAEVELPSLTLIGDFFHTQRREKLGKGYFYDQPLVAKVSMPVLTRVAKSFTAMDKAEVDVPLLTVIGEGDLRTRIQMPRLVRIEGRLSVDREAEVELPALTIVKGNVGLSGKASLPLLANVDGSLTSKTNNVELPKLKEVARSVEIQYYADLPSLVKVGLNFLAFDSISVPSLEYIGGYIHIRKYIGPTQFRSSQPEGLLAPKLTCVAGQFYPTDISKCHMGHLKINSSNSELYKSLVEVTGNLSIEAEVDLPFLIRVGGNLEITSHTSLAALIKVGGSVFINHNVRAQLAGMVEIGKNLILSRDSVTTTIVPHLPKLMRVGGDLRADIDLVLPVLYEVGGKLDVWASELPMLSMVRGIASIHGNAKLPMLLRAESNVDIYRDVDLPRLIYIGGGVSVRGKANLPVLMYLGGHLVAAKNCWLPVLTEVGGDVQISSFAYLPLLVRIKGRLEINDTVKLPNLAEVGGALRNHSRRTALLPALAFVSGKRYIESDDDDLPF